MRQPTLFVAHGGPPLIEDGAWTSELRHWGRALPRPRSILVLSAHWVQAPLTIGSTQPVPLVYDFNGFPRRYYELSYPAPGAPELAARVRELVEASGQPVASDPTRGLDHGVYIPFMSMYPDADIPVLQVSLPTLEPAALVELGRTLAPLRDEGTLIIGSGALTHNLGATLHAGTPVAAWALEMDAWTDEVLRARDVEALVQFRERAPGVNFAHPTDEHFVPVLVALGAALEGDDRVRAPISGFCGCLSKRSLQFG